MRKVKIINLKEIDSTNTYAWKLAERGEKEIVVIKADYQKKGRGRWGRKWYSPRGKGIYASFIFTPFSRLDVSLIPLVFSLGVVRTLKAYVDKKLNIKLPNDVLINKKKIAGILVETKSTNYITEFLIVGIGVNINTKKGELPSEATSLFLETGKSYPINKIFKSLIKETISLYRKIRIGKLAEIKKEIKHYII